MIYTALRFASVIQYSYIYQIPIAVDVIIINIYDVVIERNNDGLLTIHHCKMCETRSCSCIRPPPLKPYYVTVAVDT